MKNVQMWHHRFQTNSQSNQIFHLILNKGKHLKDKTYSLFKLVALFAHLVFYKQNVNLRSKVLHKKKIPERFLTFLTKSWIAADFGCLSAGFCAWQVSVVLWWAFLAVNLRMEMAVSLFVFSTSSVSLVMPSVITAPLPSSHVIWKQNINLVFSPILAMQYAQ